MIPAPRTMPGPMNGQLLSIELALGECSQKGRRRRLVRNSQTTDFLEIAQGKYEKVPQVTRRFHIPSTTALTLVCTEKLLTCKHCSHRFLFSTRASAGWCYLTPTSQTMQRESDSGSQSWSWDSRQADPHQSSCWGARAGRYTKPPPRNRTQTSTGLSGSARAPDCSSHRPSPQHPHWI